MAERYLNLNRHTICMEPRLEPRHVHTEVHKAPRKFLPCVVAGMLAISPLSAKARTPDEHLTRQPVSTAAAHMGCPDTEYEQSFSNSRGTVRESLCGMEITYSTEDGGRTVRFDASLRSRRGAVRDLLVGSEFSVVLTENYAIVVPGTTSTWEGSFDITLPENLRGRPASFDPSSNTLYMLSHANELYFIEIRGGDWMKAP